MTTATATATKNGASGRGRHSHGLVKKKGGTSGALALFFVVLALAGWQELRGESLRETHAPHGRHLQAVHLNEALLEDLSSLVSDGASTSSASTVHVDASPAAKATALSWAIGVGVAVSISPPPRTLAVTAWAVNTVEGNKVTPVQPIVSPGPVIGHNLLQLGVPPHNRSIQLVQLTLTLYCMADTRVEVLRGSLREHPTAASLMLDDDQVLARIIEKQACVGGTRHATVLVAALANNDIGTEVAARLHVSVMGTGGVMDLTPSMATTIGLAVVSAIVVGVMWIFVKQMYEGRASCTSAQRPKFFRTDDHATDDELRRLAHMLPAGWILEGATRVQNLQKWHAYEAKVERMAKRLPSGANDRWLYSTQDQENALTFSAQPVFVPNADGVATVSLSRVACGRASEWTQDCPRTMCERMCRPACQHDCHVSVGSCDDSCDDSCNVVRVRAADQVYTQYTLSVRKAGASR